MTLIRDRRVSARFIPEFPCRAPPRHTPLHINSGVAVPKPDSVKPFAITSCVFGVSGAPWFLCNGVHGPLTRASDRVRSWNWGQDDVLGLSSLKPSGNHAFQCVSFSNFFALHYPGTPPCKETRRAAPGGRIRKPFCSKALHSLADWTRCISLQRRPGAADKAGPPAPFPEMGRTRFSQWP